MKAFLAVRSPGVSKTGNKAVLVGRAADVLTWAPDEREQCTDDILLAQAVTVKIASFEEELRRQSEEAEERALAAQRDIANAQRILAIATRQLQLHPSGVGAASGLLQNIGVREKRPEPPSERKQEQKSDRKQEQSANPHTAATSAIAALQPNDRLSLFYSDDGCNGFVVKLTDHFVFICGTVQ